MTPNTRAEFVLVDFGSITCRDVSVLTAAALCLGDHRMRRRP